MVLFTDESIDSKLMDSHLKIINCRDDKKIAPAMGLYGFLPETYTFGFTKYQTAFDLHLQRKVEIGEQMAATEAFLKALDDTDEEYMKHLKVARVACRYNVEIIRQTELLDERKDSFTGWSDQAVSFYINFMKNGEAMAQMGKFLITPEALQATLAKVENCIQLKATQALETGDAQEATKLRDDALDELLRWVADLVAIARVALADSPQLLEKLNIVAPS